MWSSWDDYRNLFLVKAHFRSTIVCLGVESIQFWTQIPSVEKTLWFKAHSVSKASAHTWWDLWSPQCWSSGLTNRSPISCGQLLYSKIELASQAGLIPSLKSKYAILHCCRWCTSKAILPLPTLHGKIFELIKKLNDKWKIKWKL